MDPFPFVLARWLRMTVAELDARMSYDEYLRWRAFSNWERWKKEQAQSLARVHAQGGQ